MVRYRVRPPKRCDMYGQVTPPVAVNIHNWGRCVWGGKTVDTNPVSSYKESVHEGSFGPFTSCLLLLL